MDNKKKVNKYHALLAMFLFLTILSLYKRPDAYALMTFAFFAGYFSAKIEKKMDFTTTKLD
jgi:hypothetical protein